MYISIRAGNLLWKMRNLGEKIMIPAPHNPIEINWNWNKIHCFDYYFFWLHTKIVFLFLSGNRKTLTWFSYPKCIKSFIDLVVCFNICEVKQTQEKATTFFFLFSNGLAAHHNRERAKRENFRTLLYYVFFVWLSLLLLLLPVAILQSLGARVCIERKKCSFM